MQLRFLGTPYSTTIATAETTPLETSGTYRGTTVSFRRSQPKAVDATVPLRYRGKNYLR